MGSYMKHTEIETDDDELPESCVDAVLTPKKTIRFGLVNPEQRRRFIQGHFIINHMSETSISPIGGATGSSGNLSTSLSNVARLAAHPKFVWVFNANCDGTIIYNDPVLVYIMTINSQITVLLFF
jgi:hypothetical protein